VRVLDLSHHVAGPFCTKLFADYGADVVKVERPGRGDAARWIGPFRDDVPDVDSGGLFNYLNSDKRGITLNLKSATGVEAVRRLVREADVLVESFRPGTLERLGLTDDELGALNPRLVVCSISNFGQTGPYRDYAASELVFQAMSGLTYGSGELEREPLWIPLFIAQQLAGVTAYTNCLAALRYAQSEGEGLFLDISILESLMEIQELMMSAYFYSRSTRRRLGHRRDTNHPACILPCKDGYAPILVVHQRDWQELARLMEHPEMADDPRFATGPARAEHADEIDAALVPWLARHTAEEVFQLSQARRIPVSRVLDPRGILNLPHLHSREFFRTIDLPSGDQMQCPGSPFKATPAADEPLRPAPRLGQHNAEILNPLLKLKPDELPALARAGVV
jgi:crotonobetainyl-CoA:carnitine CoA-transferase CaiB-like acyl-CoA transferase